MKRTRIKLSVYVDLDPVPGQFHTAELAQAGVAAILRGAIPHYDPMVLIGSHDTSISSVNVSDGYEPRCMYCGGDGGHYSNCTRNDLVQYTACSFALDRGRYCTIDVRIPHEHPSRTGSHTCNDCGAAPGVPCVPGCPNLD